MKLIYNIGILIYTILVRIVSPFNSKAALWIAGRKSWESDLKNRVDPAGVNIWIHCASLGEFEQGRPVIEAIKKKRPEIKIILTFFSPSGYEIRKNYKLADHVCYLPADTSSNASKFISAVNPSAVIFVKYEFWHNYISILKERKIPLYLVSGIFRPGQHFFGWYGKFFREMLFSFTHIFVQDMESRSLLANIGIRAVRVAGDTRFDRVVEIAALAREIPILEQFCSREKVVLAGSSWKQDEEIIAGYIAEHPGRMKWIFAPHEIEKTNVDRLHKLLGNGVVRFSEYTEKEQDKRIMIIDNIGMLSSAYRYAFIAAIGGGFGKGIHNILEAACWGVPVVFGPNHLKFREAIDLLSVNGARSFSSYEDFKRILDEWISDDDAYSKSARNALDYVRKNTGATEIILSEMNLKDMNSPFS